MPEGYIQGLEEEMPRPAWNISVPQVPADRGDAESNLAVHPQ